MNRYDLMEALNAVDEKQVQDAGRFYEAGREQKTIRKPARVFRAALIAAAITALLGVTAYAAGVFNLRARETEPEETFPVHFAVMDGPDIEGNWTGTFALELDAPVTCQPVRYRFGWLPEDVSLLDGHLDEDGWVRRRDWDGTVGYVPWGDRVELVGEDRDRYLVSNMYYAPQFVNGGALILMSALPDTVEEEVWGELNVLKIRSEAYESWKNGRTVYEDGLPRNYLLLFQPEQGWILALRGTFTMEELVKIAENAEIVQTEGLVEQSQYQNPYDFFDAARG